MRAIRAIERQLVLEEGDSFDFRRNIPLLAVLVVSSVLFLIVQFRPEVLARF
ncbi:hypothetical protein KDL44_08385 [bacterium]|nr:hypothetical protein [bacterium]